MNANITLTISKQKLDKIILDREILLPERLKKLREKHNMTMEKIAALISVKRQTYNGYEAAPDKTYHRSPSYDVLIRLAALYGVSTDYLIGLTDNPAPRSAALDVMEVLENNRTVDKNTRQYISAMLRQILAQQKAV